MPEAQAQNTEVLVALVNAVTGREAEFESWYWGTHIPEILKLPGFTAARCLRLNAGTGPMAPHRYATLYEISGSAEDARQLLFTSNLSSSDALDPAGMVMAPYEVATQVAQ